MTPRELIGASGPLGSSSVQQMLKRVSRIEALEEARLAGQGGMLKSLMPGIKPSSATGMARKLIKSARTFGDLHALGVSYELQDNAALLLHFHSKRGRISEALRIPLQFGYKVRRPFREVGLAETVGQYLPRDPWDYSYFEEASPVARASIWRQPEFIARGFYRPGRRGAYEAVSAGEQVVSQVERMFGMIGPKNVSRDLRAIQTSVEDIYKTSIFGGALSPYEFGAPIESPAAILQASQMQVLSERGVPLAETLKGEKTFPIDIKGGFRRERAYAHMLAFRKQKFLQAAGLSDLPLKPETGLKSFVTGFKHGHLVPFGGYADPTRQTYQRWALMPLAERARPTAVTTGAFEAAAQAVSPAGGRKAFRLPTSILYTADPRIERAIAASQGGMIISGPVQKALQYTLGGETRMPGVGSALIAGMGGKFTVSAIAEMGPDIGAIASMSLLRKGGEGGFVTKHPDAVRKLIVEEILSQVGTVKPGGPQQRAKLSFLQELSTELSGKLVLHKKGRYTRYPQMQLGPGADLNLDRVERLVRSYNKQAGALGGITTGIRRLSADIIGAEGPVEDIMGYVAPDWLAKRANQEMDVINYAMRRGQPVTGLGDMGMTYTPAYGKGMKIRLKDIANIGIYGTPESEALAKVMTQAVEQAGLERKQDIFKTFLPILGTHTVAGGIKLDTLREAHPFIGLPTGKAEFQASELVGTIFDPTHPAFKGFTLNLDEPMKVPGLHADVWTTQVHMPGMPTLGFMPESKVIDGVEQQIYHISPAQRAVYKAYRQAMGDPAGLRDEVVRSLDEISKASLSKTGLLRKLIEPRMGQSGYFRLVGMGEGAAAEALGTALKPVKLATGEVIHQAATVAISEADVRSMGLYKQFQAPGAAPRGYMFGLMSAYPAQSYAHNRAVLYKMTSKANVERLGPGGLGVHQALSIQMLRDFDADNVGAMILSGKQGQQILKNLAVRHHAPEIAAQAIALDRILSEEQRMLKGMGNAPSVTDPAVLSFKELMSYADDSVTAAAHNAQRTAATRAEQFYGVKAMTPALNWWSGRMRTFLGEEASGKTLKAAQAILSSVEQAGAVAKGAGVAAEASALVDFSSKMSVEFLKSGVLEKQERASLLSAVRSLHEKALESGEGILATYKPGHLTSGTLAVARASRTWRRAVEEGKAFPKGLVSAITKVPGDAPTKAMLQAIAVTDESMIKALESEQATLARSAGLSQLIESGQVVAKSPHVSGPATVEAAIQSLNEAGALGKELPAPILDRVIDWFRRPSVPSYQKAAIIGGGALLGGAVVKNLLFPGFTPSTEAGMPPTQVAVPIPVRMPNAEQAQMPGIFDRMPGSPAVESTFSMPPDFAGFGTRTPMPAVQMGAGTMQPGVLPKLMGDMFREAPPAPMVLNQDAYNRDTPGVAAPPTARAAEPIEMPHRAFSVSAQAPASGFDLRGLIQDMPSVDVRVMMDEDESELSILRSLSENEHSAYS